MLLQKSRRYLNFRAKIGSYILKRIRQGFVGISGFRGYLSHTIEGMSNFCGYITISWVRQTFVGMSHFRWYVTLSWECQNFSGMSNFRGNVTRSYVYFIITILHFYGHIQRL